MARAASAPDISMKPKPRGRPVSRSLMSEHRSAVRREQRTDGFFSGGKGRLPTKAWSQEFTHKGKDGESTGHYPSEGTSKADRRTVDWRVGRAVTDHVSVQHRRSRARLRAEAARAAAAGQSSSPRRPRAARASARAIQRDAQPSGSCSGKAGPAGCAVSWFRVARQPAPLETAYRRPRRKQDRFNAATVASAATPGTGAQPAASSSTHASRIRDLDAESAPVHEIQRARRQRFCQHPCHGRLGCRRCSPGGTRRWRSVRRRRYQP